MPGAHRFSPAGSRPRVVCSRPRPPPGRCRRSPRPGRPTCCWTPWPRLATAGPCGGSRRAARRPTDAFAAQGVSAADNFRWGWLTTVPANVLWDEESWQTINERQLQVARDAGALARLPIDLTALAILRRPGAVTSAAAAAAIAETDAVVEATETRIAPYAAMLLAALRGREADGHRADRRGGAGAPTRADRGSPSSTRTGPAAVLFNGLGHYDQAMSAAERAAADSPELFLSGVGPARAHRGRRRESANAPRRRGGLRPPGRGHDGRRHRLGAGPRGPLPRPD